MDEDRYCSKCKSILASDGRCSESDEFPIDCPGSELSDFDDGALDPDEEEFL